jgi:carbamoyltransferase
MTITCNVKPQWRALIPAVVHVDGTARPQTINRLQNPLGYEILLQYEQLTGIPILINTSFNVHEEPIILDLPTGLKSLSGGQIDVLVTQTHIYSRRV